MVNSPYPFPLPSGERIKVRGFDKAKIDRLLGLKKG